jgi:hypothetical protein
LLNGSKNRAKPKKGLATQSVLFQIGTENPGEVNTGKLRLSRGIASHHTFHKLADVLQVAEF